MSDAPFPPKFLAWWDAYLRDHLDPALPPEHVPGLRLLAYVAWSEGRKSVRGAAVTRPVFPIEDEGHE